MVGEHKFRVGPTIIKFLYIVNNLIFSCEYAYANLKLPHFTFKHAKPEITEQNTVLDCQHLTSKNYASGYLDGSTNFFCFNLFRTPSFFLFFFKIKIELVPNFTIFSLQILSSRFLWAITSRQKSNFSD